MMSNNGGFADNFVTADPASVHLYDRAEENVLSIYPESKPENGGHRRLEQQHTQVVHIYKVLVHVAKVIAIVAAIAIGALLLRHLIAGSSAEKTQSSQMVSIPKTSTHVPTTLSTFSTTTASSSATSTTTVKPNRVIQPQKYSEYCPGQGWVPFKDEKCFKLIKKWSTREEAARACKLEYHPADLEAADALPRLVIINSSEEQAFLTQLMFSNSELNVWIGATRNSNGQLHWDDGTSLSFTDWAPGPLPSLGSEKNCVEMHETATSTKDDLDGKWRLVSCQLVNYVVCEKMQKWSFEKLQKAFLATRRALEISDEQLNSALKNLEETKLTLDELKNQATDAEVHLPVGFIYVQLPEEAEPLTLWPQYVWHDVTSNYSGLFFRAGGGSAAEFGHIQEEQNGGQLESVEFSELARGVGDGTMSLTPGTCTSVKAGGYDGRWTSIKYCLGEGEVRPRNMAVHIWKRGE